MAAGSKSRSHSMDARRDRSGGYHSFDRHDGETHCVSPRSEPPIPGREHQVAAVDSERAGQVNRIGTAQCMGAGEFPRVLLDRFRQLNRSGHRPESAPVLHSGSYGRCVQPMITAGGRQRCTNFYMGKSARYGRVASPPEVGHHVAGFLLDQQFDEGAGVEVDQHVQSRCSDTRSDTEPRARTRVRPVEIGRSVRSGLLMTPAAVSSSSRVAVCTPTKRATGTPRSVTTISSPLRA
jgi:hypothetical protein